MPCFHCLALCIFGICCSSLSHALFPLFGSLHFWNLLLFPFSCLVSIVWLFAFLEFVALPFLMPCFHCLALCIFGICCSSLSHALFPLFGSLHFWNLLLLPVSCLVSIVWLFAFLEFVALPFLMPCFHCLALCSFGICCSSLFHDLFPLFGSLHFRNLLLFPFSCLFLEFVALPFLMPCFHCLALCIFGICCSSLSHALFPLFGSLQICCSSLSHAFFLNLLLFPFSCLFLEFVALPFLMPFFGICCSSLSHALVPLFGSLHFLEFAALPFLMPFFGICCSSLSHAFFGTCCSSLSHALFPLFGSLHFLNLLLFPFSCLVSIVCSLLFWNLLLFPFSCLVSIVWLFAFLEFVALPFLMPWFRCLALCIFGICCSSFSYALFPLVV